MTTNGSPGYWYHGQTPTYTRSDPIQTLTRRDYVAEWMDNLRFMASCWTRFPCEWVTRKRHAVFVGKREPLVFRHGSKEVRVA